ncbi:MAG: branched-chain amino acid ABC transporter substrate-binding protein [Actinobacteria bacterium]|nr:branched-chain amino acid ABC transporter substrate-binding protein [Actinomycetota bacterium]
MSRRNLAITAGFLAAGAIATSAMAANIGGNPGASDGPIFIAVEGPQTGAQASNGQDMLRGVQLAVNQVNAKGGVLGRQVRIVKANDQANPSLAKTVAGQVISGSSVAVIGPYNSSVGLLNLPLYTSNKIVPVQLTSTDDTTGEGVTVQPKNSQISPIEFNYIKATFAPTRVSMLVTQSTYTQGMADRLQASLLRTGVLVTQIPVAEGQADYSAEVKAALADKPTVLYLSTYFPEGALIAKQFAASGSSAKCFAGLANQDPGFITAAGIADSQACVFSGVPEPTQFPTAKNYVKQYKATFNKNPGTWGTFTYDSANILFAAWKKAGTTTYAPVIRQLKKTTNFAGATGKITIDTQGNRPNVPVKILRVNSLGKFVVIS